MGNIQLLPETLRDQIAAGEVVERPANIVKELLENALDAGATHIDVEIGGGGVESILVRDDGNGMDEADALLALERHATSKISKSDDLFALHTFGFRGEALAAIAAISHLTLTTRREEDLSGIRVQSGMKTAEAVAANVGTEIRIADIFYNVPARRKFLKSSATENAHIVEIVEHMALAEPTVAFRLQLDGKTVIDVPPASGEDPFLNRLVALYGKELSNNFFPIHYLGTDLSIAGVTSHPHLHRRNRKQQRLFVNKRPISDRLMFAAISEAYESLIPRGFFSESIIFLQIAPDLVDVNVHPRKSEVKFLHEREVFLAVRGALQSALQRAEETEAGQRSWTLAAPESSSDGARMPEVRPFSTIANPLRTAWSSQKSTQFPPSRNAEFSAPKFAHQSSEVTVTSAHWKVIGQIRNSFILVEDTEGLLIFDQHAAHERVRYEQLMRAMRERQKESQKLLLPQIFALTPGEHATLMANQEVFTAFGFEIQDFSQTEVAVFAVPAGLERSDLRMEMKNLLAELERDAPEEGKLVSKAAERIATFAACRGAIKFGDPLTLPEMEQLLTDLAACEGFAACAHGRPVAMRISYGEMEGKMGR